MRIALLNQSTAAAPAGVLVRIATACEAQSLDYAALWQSGAYAVEAFDTLDKVPADACLVTLLDDADQADALGYHDTTPDGRPYAKVFTGPILGSGGTWTDGPLCVSQTVSHEVLEAIGDPYANWWSDEVTPTGAYEKAIELCDMVESDFYLWRGVSLSNFLGPRAFAGNDREPGPFDWMGKVADYTSLHTPRSGCYEIRRGISGTSYPVFGEMYPEWRKVQKAHPAARMAKRLGLHRPYDLLVIGEDVPDASAAEIKRLWRYANSRHT